MLADSYTKALRLHDKDLFVGKNREGVLCVFRKAKRYEPVVVDEGLTILNLKSYVQYVFSLTENWTLATKPKDWGIDTVVNRIKMLDLWENERLVEEMDAANERVDEAEKRKFRNEAEAFLADNRREFAKAFDASYGTLTSLSKDEPRKRLKDRSIKNGNC